MKCLKNNRNFFNRVDFIEQKNLKKENGITLIALVVTIIILIILAGISITNLTDRDGIINRARDNSESAQKESIIEKIEANLLKEKTKTGNTPSLDELKTIIQENEYNDGALGKDSFVTKDGGYTIYYNEINGWKNLFSNIAQPGDYVAYIPDTIDNEKINNLLLDLNTYSGNDSNNSSTIYQENLNWRVLDVQGEQVRLISEEPTVSTISLYGAKGYNNAVYLIDKACEELYSNSKFSIEVQNLKIEDIQEKLTYDYTQYENANVDTGKYGGFSIKLNTDNTYYPAIYAQEKNNGVGGTKNKGVLGLSEQKELVAGEYLKTNSLGSTQTYWGKKAETNMFSDDIYYEIFINKDSNNYEQYYLSSRMVNVGTVSIYFGTYGIHNGEISCRHLYYSDNSSFPLTYSFRPVITLNSSISIEQGDGKTAGTAYQISI